MGAYGRSGRVRPRPGPVRSVRSVVRRSPGQWEPPAGRHGACHGDPGRAAVPSPGAPEGVRRARVRLQRTTGVRRAGSCRPTRWRRRRCTGPSCTARFGSAGGRSGSRARNPSDISKPALETPRSARWRPVRAARSRAGRRWSGSSKGRRLATPGPMCRSPRNGEASGCRRTPSSSGRDNRAGCTTGFDTFGKPQRRGGSNGSSHERLAGA